MSTSSSSLVTRHSSCKHDSTLATLSVLIAWHPGWSVRSDWTEMGERGETEHVADVRKRETAVSQ